MNEEDPTCYKCGGVCAGGSQGLWCCVCAAQQPLPDPEPEKTEWAGKLEAARARALAKAQDRTTFQDMFSEVVVNPNLDDGSFILVPSGPLEQMIRASGAVNEHVHEWMDDVLFRADYRCSKGHELPVVPLDFCGQVHCQECGFLVTPKNWAKDA